MSIFACLFAVSASAFTAPGALDPSIAATRCLHRGTLRPLRRLGGRRRPSFLTAGREGADREAAGDRRESVDREMLAIAAPALVGLAIDPLASLVDTAFVGRLCSSADLAGAGVSIGLFNLLSRTFNFINTATTSSVAAASSDEAPGVFTTEMGRQASAALAVAVGVGVGLALLMTLGGGALLRLLGVGADSPLRAPARAYLAARAIAAPATLSLMALQGAYRGARDTRTPLGALALASALNIVLGACEREHTPARPHCPPRSQPAWDATRPFPLAQTPSSSSVCAAAWPARRWQRARRNTPPPRSSGGAWPALAATRARRPTARSWACRGLRRPIVRASAGRAPG